MRGEFMGPWWVGVFLLGWLSMGCGGGQANLAKVDTSPPAAVAAPETVDLGGDQEDSSLMEQLSAQRLEELYAKSGIPGWDPAVEEELKKGDARLRSMCPSMSISR
jgi:hypothetical protein